METIGFKEKVPPRPGGRQASQLEKICEQRLAVLGEYRLGMKLHALDLVCTVPQTHDQTVGRLGRDL